MSLPPLNRAWRRARSWGLVAAPLLLAACSSAPVDAPLPAASSSSITPTEARSQIEAALHPQVEVAGEPLESLPARMARLGVAQASVAVYRAGVLDWVAAYGESADTATLFQAASMSKVVAAVGIATLARARGVSLDADITGDFAGIDLAALNPGGVPITLRGLLSHTNGATVGGFPGYPHTAELPTNTEVVAGSERTNTPPVVIRAEGVGQFSYSGGGFQLAQLWAEQVSGEDFATLMHRLVLEPVGMTRSTFAQPLGEDFVAAGNIGLAYTGAGTAVPGGWHNYPEQAAAGLWSTPTDYGRFVMALVSAAKGDATAGLDPGVVAEVILPVANNYGLGVGVEVKDGVTVLRHAGGNEGYRCYFEAFLEPGDAIVTMTGSPRGLTLSSDITRTAKRLYGWPVSEPRVVERFPMSEETLAGLAGRYVFPDGGRSVEIFAAPPNLGVRLPDGGRATLVPIAADLFIDPDDAQEIRFAPDEDGRMTLRAGDRVLTRAETP